MFTFPFPPAIGLTLYYSPHSYDDATELELDELRQTIGYPVPGVEARIVDLESGKEVEWDGETSGELQVSLPVRQEAYESEIAVI